MGQTLRNLRIGSGVSASTFHEWALSLKSASWLAATTAITPAAFHGIQDSPDVAGHTLDSGVLFRNPGVLLFHAREHLADVLPQLLIPAAVLQELVAIPRNDLGEVSHASRDQPDLAAEFINSVLPPDILVSELGELIAHLGKPGRCSVHVVAQDRG